jgi:peptidyl-prolyl cis-trans isomerase B (cyclophilin B)
MTRQICIAVLLLSCCLIGCAQKKDHVVTIKTKYGDMVAILYDETPKHKANFIKLAKEHFYDSLIFHRVIEGFMIQGGDPESKKAQPGQRLGNGGPGYNVDAEINPKFFHEKGALSAARLGDQMNPTKASSGSQFYIVQGKKMSANEVKIDPQKFNMAMQQFFQKPENKVYYDTIAQLYQTRDAKAYEAYIGRLKPIVENQLGTKVEKDVLPEMLQAYTTVGGTPSLDGQYTVFGKVIKGLEVIDKIAAVAKDHADRPTEDVRMTVSVEELPKSKIEKLYGYKYPAEIKKK